VARGDFTKKINISSNDEIGELAESFNLMSDRLRELDQLKADFISNITHDLKTPLASITEANQLLIDGIGGSISSRQHHLLHIIREDATRLLRLIESIIDLSKMESGVLRYDFAPCDISHVITEAIASLTLLAESKKLHIRCSIEKNLPVLCMDRDKIIQALINLLGNAIKFTPESGSVTVAAAHLPDRSKAGRPDTINAQQALQISISDTGTGITPEDLPRIFDKFYQGHFAHKKGSGLGLAIARYIIQAHGGEIWAESKKGLGSTFYIVLPVINHARQTTSDQLPSL
jgi:two-component system sensor histidine kinase GlrK